MNCLPALLLAFLFLSERDANPLAQCVDLAQPGKTSDCPAKAYLCTNTLYRDLMKQQCPKTCGYCTSSTNTATTAATTASSGCVDLAQPGRTSDCPANAYLCTNAAYIELMKQQCPKTCGYCTGSNVPSGTTAAPAQMQGCQSTKISAALRTQIVDLHNRLRSSLANGQEPTVGGRYAPSGKNIYKLTYDCDLENQAQRWADQCTFSHSGVGDASENLYYGWGGNVSPEQHVPAAIQMWWNELAQYGISDTQNRLTMTVFNSGVGHFTAMAWGSSTKVGCGFGTNCRYNGQSAAYVVCQYRPTGNYINQVIYELGPPCTANSQCTTYANSKCSVSEGLCYL